jgi:hypothetical protein
MIRVEEQAAGDAFDRVAAMKAHRDRMAALRERAPNANDAAVSAALACYIAEANLWLAEVKARQEPTGYADQAQDAEQPGLERYDPSTRAILVALEKPLNLSFTGETPLEDVLKYIKEITKSERLPNGLPIYIHPDSLEQAGATSTSPITFDLSGVPLKTTFRLLLKQLKLTYVVKDGVVMVGSMESSDFQGEIGRSGPVIGGGDPVPGYGAVPADGFPRTVTAPPAPSPARGGSDAPQSSSNENG